MQKKERIRSDIKYLNGVLSYYLKKDPKHRDRKLIENQIIKRETEFVKLEKGEIKIKECLKKGIKNISSKRELGTSSSYL